jgi:hypothetical protein
VVATRDQETDMSATQGPPPDSGSIILLIVLIAGLCVIYWRIAVRIAAVVIISIAIYGAVLVVEGLDHVPR